MSRFSHLNDAGEAHMVDVSKKEVTARHAIAEATIVMQPQTLEEILAGGVAKGDVLAVARVAGIQGAKRTPELIPLCHPLQLSKVSVDFAGVANDRLKVTVTCKVAGQTGVEMEALTGASVAALTIYDMCKAVDRGMTIESVGLVEKAGGKSGTWTRPER